MIIEWRVLIDFNLRIIFHKCTLIFIFIWENVHIASKERINWLHRSWNATYRWQVFDQRKIVIRFLILMCCLNLTRFGMHLRWGNNKLFCLKPFPFSFFWCCGLIFVEWIFLFMDSFFVLCHVFINFLYLRRFL